MKWIRKLYDWVIHWAETPYAVPALVVLAFAESSFFPIPPDFLLIPVCLGCRSKSFRYALYATVASVIGGILGYYIGHVFYETVGIKIIHFYHAEDLFKSLCARFNEYGFLAIVVPALTPIPYKIFTISAGMAKVSMPTFLIASIVGRGIRFFAVAGLLWFFGRPIKAFIDKYFNLLSFVAVILLIGGFILVKYFA